MTHGLMYSLLVARLDNQPMYNLFVSRDITYFIMPEVIHENFSWALQQLKNWESVFRSSWNGHHNLTLQTPTPESKMNRPYIYMCAENGDIIPWVASQTDLLALDWEIVREVDPA